MNFTADLWALWITKAILQASVVFSIYRRSLQPYFGFFQLYLVLSLAVTLSQITLVQFSPEKMDLYAEIFILSTYLLSVFEFLAIREVSTRTLARFPAIRTASSRALVAFWCVIAVVGAAWYFYLSSSPTQKFPLLYAAVRYQDAASVGFTLYILLFLAFIAWMPVPLHRSLMNHVFILCCYFILVALSRFIAQAGNFHLQRPIADYVALGGISFVFVFWLFRVNSVPDESLQIHSGPLNAAEAERLLARLDELNVSLSRSHSR